MNAGSTNKAAETKELETVTVTAEVKKPGTDAKAADAVIEAKEEKTEKAAPEKTAAAEEKPVKRGPGRRPGVKKEKTEKPELKPEVFVEFQGNTASEALVIERIKAAYVAEGHRASSIKSLRIYMKPEEGKAYYVLNEKISRDVDLY